MMNIQSSRKRFQLFLILIVCAAAFIGGCDNSGKQMKLPSLEGAPEALGAPKNK